MSLNCETNGEQQRVKIYKLNPIIVSCDFILVAI